MEKKSVPNPAPDKPFGVRVKDNELKDIPDVVMSDEDLDDDLELLDELEDLD